MTKPETGWKPIEVTILPDPNFVPIEVGAVPTEPAKSATPKEH